MTLFISLILLFLALAVLDKHGKMENPGGLCFTIAFTRNLRPPYANIRSMLVKKKIIPIAFETSRSLPSFWGLIVY